MNVRIMCALAVAALAGCASGEPVSVPPPSLNYAHGDQVLYGLLVKDGDGKYTFREVTDEHSEPLEGYLVRLNDLSPAFDTRTVECRGEHYAANDKCNEDGDFRSQKHGVVSALIMGGKAVSTVGASLAESKAPYVTEFDAAEFNRAVDEALSATGLDEDRPALLENLDGLRERSEAYQDEIARLYRTHIAAYERDMADAVSLVTAVDGSTEYYEDDIRFDSLFELEPNPIDLPDAATSDPTEALLPCQASRCAAEVAAALRGLQQAHAAELARLGAELDDKTAYYRMTCDAKRFAGYNLDLTCPEAVPRPRSAPGKVPVRVTVLSRDFERLYPEFEHADENLRISFDGREITWSNLTDSYLEVKSVSVYYNSKIHTVSPLEPSLELAPGAHARRPIDDFVSRPISIEARYRDMTADKARRASLQFGFAVKYSMDNRDMVETLYRAEVYSLDCAIKNRLDPGSCVQHADEPDKEKFRPANVTV